MELTTSHIDRIKDIRLGIKGAEIIRDKHVFKLEKYDKMIKDLGKKKTKLKNEIKEELKISNKEVLKLIEEYE